MLATVAAVTIVVLGVRALAAWYQLAEAEGEERGHMTEPFRIALARLHAQADQDRAECDRWWAEATAEDKLRLWEAIQREYDDPLLELMSRFAQLAVTEAALRASEPPGE